MNRNLHILVSNGLVRLPRDVSSGHPTLNNAEIGTILTNISYYGFALSREALGVFLSADRTRMLSWWAELEVVLKDISGASRSMDDFVVYKNFPQEVLSMSEGEYWIKQILMYWGFANEYFTQEQLPRPVMTERPACKTLHLEKGGSLQAIFMNLLRSSARWNADQLADVQFLSTSFTSENPLSHIPFKENLVALATFMMNAGMKCTVTSCTDVLRLAAGLSDQDISLRQKVKFRNFKRPERQYLLSILEGCLSTSSHNDDFARRLQLWKSLFRALHPGDYAARYPYCVKQYDALCRDELDQTFNSKVENLLSSGNPAVFQLLKARPGEFARRLRVTVKLFGKAAVEAFREVIPSLETSQLLKLRSNFEVINSRATRAFPPKGNWNKLQIVANTAQIDEELRATLVQNISYEIAGRVTKSVGSVNLDGRVHNIKLQTSDSELSQYGRGTRFPIPDSVRFIRSASYWKTEGLPGNIWFDNAWNFFNSSWENKGACAWNESKFGSGSAVFSGDPTNSKDLEGRACQMIDLYPKKLKAAGVRYAVWNVLAYSGITFSEADDVLATLQFGEKPDAGRLFEPSRCQMKFQLKGQSKTKYIAMIDFHTMELVYLDANLFGTVDSAASNGDHLTRNLPAFLECIDSLPSVADLFSGVPRSEVGIKVLYDDSTVTLKGEKAYVFRPQNESSSFEPILLNELI